MTTILDWFRWQDSRYLLHRHTTTSGSRTSRPNGGEVTAELHAVPEPVPSIERHPFVPGEAKGIYCATCQTVRKNRRHMTEPTPGDAA